jgi:tRNA nucleotidyltransferase (CCA-adding enzyme)
LGYRLYAVGGFVRDLILGVPNFDIDLVVEGDAIQLAQRLAERLGGHVRSHRRFGTAKWIVPDDLRADGSGDGLLPASLDFVTARTEFYEHPTALPTVERSTIKQDLHRRDFTINTLAVRLDSERWGQLLDFYGGKKDLDDGIIRVLHSLSFVEDPTRILRAARFEQRFGFTIEPRTERLIADARDLLARVSGERVRHEFLLAMDEAEPEKVLCRLADLGVLKVLQPELQCDTWLREKAHDLRIQFAMVRETRSTVPPHMSIPVGALARLHLALATYRLSASALEEFIEHYRLLKGDRDLILEIARLRERLPRLMENTLPASAIVEILDESTDEARLLLRVATDSWLVRQRLDQYQRRLRHVRSSVQGEDLRRMGIQPGPIYGDILRRLRAGRLDGQIRTREEEELIVKEMLVL